MRYHENKQHCWQLTICGVVGMAGGWEVDEEAGLRLEGLPGFQQTRDITPIDLAGLNQGAEAPLVAVRVYCTGGLGGAAI